MRSFVDIDEFELKRRLNKSSFGIVYSDTDFWPHTLLRRFDYRLGMRKEAIPFYLELWRASKGWVENHDELSQFVRIGEPTEIGTDFIARPWSVGSDTVDHLIAVAEDESGILPSQVTTMQDAFRRAVGEPRNEHEKIVIEIVHQSLIAHGSVCEFIERTGTFVVLEPDIGADFVLRYAMLAGFECVEALITGGNPRIRENRGRTGRLFVDIDEVELKEQVRGDRGVWYSGPTEWYDVRLLRFGCSDDAGGCQLGMEMTTTYADMLGAMNAWVKACPNLSRVLEVKLPLEVGSDFVMFSWDPPWRNIGGYKRLLFPPEEIGRMQQEFGRASVASRGPRDKLLVRVLGEILNHDESFAYFDEKRRVVVVNNPFLEVEDVQRWANLVDDE